MKLYATTTSERASKGQGGNNYLTIDITDETGKRLFPTLSVNIRKGEYGNEIATLSAEESHGIWQRLYSAGLPFKKSQKAKDGERTPNCNCGRLKALHYKNWDCKSQ